jgi:hypothetical protein
MEDRDDPGIKWFGITPWFVVLIIFLLGFTVGKYIV